MIGILNNNDKIIVPIDALNLILEYDGRIKYMRKESIYVNIISKNDYRNKIIKPKNEFL